MKRQKQITPITVVKVKENVIDQQPYLQGVFAGERQEHDNSYLFVYLGEIPNMPEHCVVVGLRTGKVYTCYHTDNFEQLPM